MLAALARACALLLALVLAWAALAKAWRPGMWRSALARYGISGTLSVVAAVGVPLAEITVAGTLALGAAPLGAVGALALLSGFSLAVMTARHRVGERVPCGCFGDSTERDYRVLLLRNGLLGLTASLVLLSGIGRAIPGGSAIAHTFPAVLVVAAMGLLGWTALRAAESLTNKDMA
jgi:hypothetical protein